jgi:hypothetical protein
MSTFIATLREIACRVDDTPTVIIIGDLVESSNRGTLLLGVLCAGLFFLLEKVTKEAEKDFPEKFSEMRDRLERMGNFYVGSRISPVLIFLLGMCMTIHDVQYILPMMKVRAADLFIGTYFFTIIAWQGESILRTMYAWKTTRRQSLNV